MFSKIQENTYTKNTPNTQTKYNREKSKQHKTQQNKTTLVQSRFTTLGQETRRAYSYSAIELTRGIGIVDYNMYRNQKVH